MTHRSSDKLVSPRTLKAPWPAGAGGGSSPNTDFFIDDHSLQRYYTDGIGIFFNNAHTDPILPHGQSGQRVNQGLVIVPTTQDVHFVASLALPYTEVGAWTGGPSYGTFLPPVMIYSGTLIDAFTGIGVGVGADWVFDPTGVLIDTTIFTPSFHYSIGAVFSFAVWIPAVPAGTYVFVTEFRINDSHISDDGDFSSWNYDWTIDAEEFLSASFSVPSPSPPPPHSSQYLVPTAKILTPPVNSSLVLPRSSNYRG